MEMDAQRPESPPVDLPQWIGSIRSKLISPRDLALTPRSPSSSPNTNFVLL
ncbi:MAG: hypothetical protein Q9174_003269 [Haloplaca sp. 1 TL-2023]